jgi:integrase
MPKASLTAVSVERIKPPVTGQVDHFDRGYPGLTLRVSYGGRRTWMLMFRHAGKFHRMTLGSYPLMSLAEARVAWRDARQEVEAGRDPRAVREKPADDFAAVLEDWLKRDQAGNRSADDVRRSVTKDALPYWQHRPVNEITKRDVMDVIDAVVDRGSPVQARRLQAHLHRFFKWCAGRDIIAVNPIAELEKPGTERARDRVLVDAELLKVWIAADSLGFPFGPAIHLLMLTGARLDEIGSLRWSEVSETEIRLPGERTKNGEPHIIPLSRPAQSVIAEIPRIAGSSFVFTTNGKTPVSGWSKTRDRLRDRAKLEEPWTPHDIRRSVSTGMNERGAEPHIVEAVLGHKVRGVAGVYNRAKHEAAKRAALEAWAAHLSAVLEGTERGVVVPMRGTR